MRPTSFFLATAVAIFAIALTSGCGGNASPRSTTGTPPSITPPTSGGGTSPSTPATVQWSSTMERFNASGTVSGSGQVTIDTAGNLNILFSGGTAGAAYTAQFCQFPYVPAPNQCFTIATMTADASGAARLNMKFPKSGTWGSGTFTIGSSSDFFNTASATLDGTALYQVVPASGANQTPASSLPQDPLSSGTINVANKTVTITVRGATPNSSYAVSECGSPTACFTQTSLVTDASGNGSVSFAVPFRPASEFQIERMNGTTAVASGFLSGFRVP